MNISYLLTLVSKAFLFLLEYIFKFSAGVVAVIVLGTEGSFFNKLGMGFGSLADVLRQLTEWPEKLVYIGDVIQDYNTLTASAFNQRYGGQAINGVMESLNEGVAYVQAVYLNLIYQPFATILATFIAFLTFYLVGRTFRFIRQRGEGSFLVRKERQLGRRFFDRSE